jgi:hypothetical protein
MNSWLLEKFVMRLPGKKDLSCERENKNKRLKEWNQQRTIDTLGWRMRFKSDELKGEAVPQLPLDC